MSRRADERREDNEKLIKFFAFANLSCVKLRVERRNGLWKSFKLLWLDRASGSLAELR
jgi:hypothetical protein